jgi:hypothetical protein
MDSPNTNSDSDNLNITPNTIPNTIPNIAINISNINILPNDDTDENNTVEDENEDEYENDEENEEEDEHEEDTHYEGFIPHFPNFFVTPNFGLNFPSGLFSGSTYGNYIGVGMDNSHILNNLNNLHGLFEMMSSNMVPMTTVNPPNPITNIINEINPSNSGNSVLTNTTINGQLINNIGNVGTQQMVDEEVNKLISSGMDNLNLVSEPVLNFIENCYLENMQYEDDIINLIRYTIKNCFSRRTEFELKELISGMIYYSFSGNNSLFSDNYDDIVLPMLHNELKRIVTQSIRLAIMRRAITVPNMEDVKLVVNPDVLEKIPKSKYVELEDKIKSMNIACTVCQDDFNNEDIVRILPCEHIYHPDCIDDWLKGHSYKCPCCRKPAAEHSAKI